MTTQINLLPDVPPMGARLIARAAGGAAMRLHQIGRIRLPATTVCARCGSPAVALAIKENGAVKAYCLPCVEQMKETSSHDPVTC